VTVAVAVGLPYAAHCNQPPMCSIISPTNDQVFVAPPLVSIFADAFDSDGSLTKVEFYEGITKL